MLDAAAHPGDRDFLAGLRAQVRKALEDDPGLAAELTALLAVGGIVVAGGHRAVAVHDNIGIISTGDGAVNEISGS